MTGECETHGCDRDAEVKVEPRHGHIPTPKRRCGPCYNAWKSGNSVTGKANVRVKQI